MNGPTKGPPSSVVVGPFTYTVTVDQASIDAASVGADTSLRGETDHALATIVIDPKLGPVQTAETLLHEVLHTVFTVAGITQDFGDEKEEQIVNRTAPLLLDLLRRNKALVDYLMGV